MKQHIDLIRSIDHCIGKIDYLVKMYDKLPNSFQKYFYRSELESIQKELHDLYLDRLEVSFN